MTWSVKAVLLQLHSWLLWIVNVITHCDCISFVLIRECKRYRFTYMTRRRACTRRSVWRCCQTSTCQMTTLDLVQDLSNRSFVRSLLSHFINLVASLSNQFLTAWYYASMVHAVVVVCVCVSVCVFVFLCLSCLSVSHMPVLFQNSST